MNDREYLVQQLRNALGYLATRIRRDVEVPVNPVGCDVQGVIGDYCVIKLTLSDGNLYTHVTDTRVGSTHEMAHSILELTDRREGIAHTFVETILATMRG